MQPTATVCRNCGNNFTGRYCNNCGEKVYYGKDKNIWHLLGEAFHFTTHFEGTFFNTLRAILTNPGKLSLDYCNGIRKKYFKPISFFLLLVVIYLLFPVFQGLNQSLHYYLQNNLYGKYAMKEVKNIMQTKQLSFPEVAALFHQKAEQVSKFLLFIIIPVMAFVSWLPGFKKRKLYFDHFIFSIEESSFLILWGFLLLPLIFALFNTIGLGGVFSSELMIAVWLAGIFLIHVTFAARRFFYFKWYYSIVFSIAYLVCLGLVVKYLYKFILFVITINQF